MELLLLGLLAMGILGGNDSKHDYGTIIIRITCDGYLGW